MIHQFPQTKAAMAKYEQQLDRYFSTFYRIKVAAIPYQRLGIDRFFFKAPSWYSVEYKTDLVAAKTGNIFLEYEHEEPDGQLTPGWARQLFAQVLIEYIPETGKIMSCSALTLKKSLAQYLNSCPMSSWVLNKRADGKVYRTRGLLVPLDKFVYECAYSVGQMKKETAEEAPAVPPVEQREQKVVHD